jgi:hypothetical protein
VAAPVKLALMEDRQLKPGPAWGPLVDPPPPPPACEGWLRCLIERVATAVVEAITFVVEKVVDAAKVGLYALLRAVGVDPEQLQEALKRLGNALGVIADIATSPLKFARNLFAGGPGHWGRSG